LEQPSEIEQKYKDLERNALTYGSVTPVNASAPIGRFLLIRRGKDVCAVRFTEFHRGHDAKPPTVWHSGEESLYAEYDWYYQGDGSGDFAKPHVKSGHSKLSQKSLVGIGRLSFQTGTIRVRCGPFKLMWDYPNSVAFDEGTRLADSGIELAPTKWREIAEVNPHDPRLQWYRYDEKRPMTYIPVDQLW
jgi:hypothetical protein